jgi:hypothetical protein
MTFSRIIFNFRTLSIINTLNNIPLHNAECRYAECRVLLIVILSVVVPSAVMLIVAMLNVVMLSVMAPNKGLVFFLNDEWNFFSKS